MAIITDIQRFLHTLRSMGVSYAMNWDEVIVISETNCEIVRIQFSEVKKDVEKAIENVKFEVGLHQLLQ